MTAVVFPVGHYTGIIPTAIGTPEHVVRVGLEQHWLSDEQLAVWMAAHGPAETGSEPWTRNRALAVARELRLPEVAARMTELEDRGLVITIDQPAVVRAYRLHPLLIGLGEDPAAPGRQRVGVPEAGVVAVLDADSYELWQWAATAPSLWATCELRSTVTGLDPHRAVDGVLRDLRTLVVHGCGYLDVVG